MKKQQYIVFGLNRFGTSVARTLAAAGNEVVAVDQDADRVAQIADDVSYAVQVDVADEDAMSGLGMEHMDGAVIAVAINMEASIVSQESYFQKWRWVRELENILRHVIFQTGLICQMITVWSRWQFHQRG